jgi:hypothetical protein
MRYRHEGAQALQLGAAGDPCPGCNGNDPVKDPSGFKAHPRDEA